MSSCYNLYIFNRKGTCLYYREWTRTSPSISKFSNKKDEEKQLYGLFWTIKNFASAIDPKDENKPKLGAQTRIGESCSFYSFKTDVYRFHFMESLSGLKFIMNTRPELDSLIMQSVLSNIYNDLFVEFVVKNPFYIPGTAFTFEKFGEKLDNYLRHKGLIVK